MKHRPAAPPDGAAQNALDDEVSARCVAFAREHARGAVEGLYGPESLSWEMYREPATLLAGLSAVLLQMAHPRVAAGVSQHSSFAEDVLGRAKRTSAALYQLVFCPLDGALAVTHRLHRVHRRVWGRVLDPDVGVAGGEYRANDQPLLAWVSATAAVAGFRAFEAFVRPLTDADRARAHREMRVGSASVGVLPEAIGDSYDDFMRRYEAALDGPELQVGASARAIADVLFGRLLGPFEELMTAGFLPPRWRDAYCIRWDGPRQRRFDAVVSGVRAAVRATPAPYGYVVAWHQAQARLARARGETPSRWARALDRAARRWELPTGLGRAPSAYAAGG